LRKRFMPSYKEDCSQVDRAVSSLVTLINGRGIDYENL